MPIDLNDPKMAGYVPLQDFIDHDNDQSSRIRDIPYGKKKEDIQLSASSLAFPNTGEAYESPSQAIVITNAGYGPVTIYGTRLTGDFELKSAVPGSLLAGESTTVLVSFKPTSVGAKVGSIYFDTGNAAGDELIEFAGTGIVSAPEVPPDDMQLFVESVVDGYLTDEFSTVDTALSNRLRVDAAQGLTEPQQAQGRDNLGLGSAALAVQVGDAIAPILAADRLPPIVILAMGQSNMNSHTYSVGGDYTESSDVFLWNISSLGANVINGTAFAVGAYGVAPLDVPGTPTRWAQDLSYSAAKAIASRTGRSVYVVKFARGGKPIEAFLSDADLAANGWSRGAHQDIYSVWSANAATALGLVPGAPTKFDAFFWHQGESNAADSPDSYARKFGVLVNEIQNGGFILRSTPIVVGEILAVDANDNFRRHSSALRRIAYELPNVSVADSRNLFPVAEDPAGVHFRGVDVDILGRRYADLFFSPNNVSAVNEIAGRNPFDPETGLFHWAGGLTGDKVYKRKPHALGANTPTFLSDATFGKAFWSSTTAAYVRRDPIAVIAGEVYKVNYEIRGYGGATVAHRAQATCFDMQGNYTSALGFIPPSSPTGATNDIISVTFGLSGTGADVTIPAGTKFIALGMTVTAVTGVGTHAFRLNRAG